MQFSYLSELCELVSSKKRQERIQCESGSKLEIDLPKRRGRVSHFQVIKQNAPDPPRVLVASPSERGKLSFKLALGSIFLKSADNVDSLSPTYHLSGHLTKDLRGSPSLQLSNVSIFSPYEYLTTITWETS